MPQLPHRGYCSNQRDQSQGRERRVRVVVEAPRCPKQKSFRFQRAGWRWSVYATRARRAFKSIVASFVGFLVSLGAPLPRRGGALQSCSRGAHAPLQLGHANHPRASCTTVERCLARPCVRVQRTPVYGKSGFRTWTYTRLPWPYNCRGCWRGPLKGSG